MEGGGGASAAARAVSRRRGADKPYKGIRMRKWGKWVAEIREPNKRSRIWLGSYSTAVAAARAYDTAVYYLRGPTAKLNFPDQIVSGGGLRDLSAAAIREKAAEVGARVDAAVAAGAAAHGGAHAVMSQQSMMMKPSWDLNKKPEPEGPNADDYW